ncbi:hypothetical protein DM02DRAFT_695975 [Periconia macrospinosa]|uniref:Heterokaryon incompatibility domain-containing protein n=1 Tax=Periconia macrospinosa TaxID=97972 RepID=A0A2V1E0P4_9PLEO|nr:hypothetical protein DM02DRAFT_695975 [Periconia macrospinosa]
MLHIGRTNKFYDLEVLEALPGTSDLRRLYVHNIICKPLLAGDHIRLLHIHTAKDNEPTYQIIHQPLSAVTNDSFEFEAISYTLGDDIERAHQVAMMSKIYKSAKNVIVWLGIETEYTRKCKQWLIAVDEMLRKLPNSHKMLLESPTFNPDIRLLVVRSTFMSGNSDPAYATAIHQFWQQKWFTRGWIIQEYLLADHVYMVVGNDKFDSQDLNDMQTLPANLAVPTGSDTENFISYNMLMNLKTYSLQEENSKRFLKLMAQVSSEFLTTELQDSLFAFLGMIGGSGFTPDCSKPPRINFTDFAVALAKSFGSIDFLSMRSANLDELLPRTPDQLKGFPLWVPSRRGLPLSCSFHIYVNFHQDVQVYGVLGCFQGEAVHIHDQTEDAATTGRLHVRGQIIDRIERISSVKIDIYWEGVNMDYLESLLTQLKTDIPDSSFSSWSILDFVYLLNIALCGGNEVKSSSEEVLGLKPKEWGNKLINNCGYSESLGACLAMGRGRRFMKREQGRIGLVPAMGSKQREMRGMEAEGEYKVVGECFVEGIMHGEGIEEGSDPQTFILI